MFKAGHLWQEKPLDRNGACLGLSQLPRCKWLLLVTHHWQSQQDLPFLPEERFCAKANPFSSAFKIIVMVVYTKLTALHLLNIVQLLVIFILLGKHNKDITHFKKCSLFPKLNCTY